VPKSCQLPLNIAQSNPNPNIYVIPFPSSHLKFPIPTQKVTFHPPHSPLPTKSHSAQPMMMAGLLIHPSTSPKTHLHSLLVRPSIASSLHRPSITNPAEGGKKGKETDLRGIDRQGRKKERFSRMDAKKRMGIVRGWICANDDCAAQ
jgi:hypothetical protein